ncbi:YdcF family protein [Pseudorhizobium endolithicum]|uniref:YdcF family protein n=1 Tax=Pseudorhizobium endolithicum TaxID=1191678 RepID=A0ABM8PRD5_9HYPH|nr:YdcF family protein [Pseudorhizobium endolithicum]CAD7044342.1 YdcF family protein [Pseudorhizobium endolithicum]
MLMHDARFPFEVLVARGTVMRIESALVTRRAKGLALFVSCALAMGSCLYGGALLWADALLTTRSAPKHAEVIVVLGGDGPRRAAHAAKLWTSGLAASVLVVGRGDCLYIRQRLIDDGVRPETISLECRSASTWENAQFAEPLLTRMGARSAILVTSWFHSRRALQRFRSVMPEIDWISLPTHRSGSMWDLASGSDGLYVFKEYLKILVYQVRSSITLLSDKRKAMSSMGGEP